MTIRSLLNYSTAVSLQFSNGFYVHIQYDYYIYYFNSTPSLNKKDYDRLCTKAKKIMAFFKPFIAFVAATHFRLNLGMTLACESILGSF